MKLHAIFLTVKATDNLISLIFTTKRPEKVTDIQEFLGSASCSINYEYTCITTSLLISVQL